MYIFLIHSPVDGHLSCFHVLAIVNRAAMNIVVHDSFWIMVFSGYMPSSGIAGSYGSSIFSFFKEPPYYGGHFLYPRELCEVEYKELAQYTANNKHFISNTYRGNFFTVLFIYLFIAAVLNLYFLGQTGRLESQAGADITVFLFSGKPQFCSKGLHGGDEPHPHL